MKKVIGGKFFVPKKKKDKLKPWKGQHLFDKKYWITSILAKRRSGKTTIITNLIRQFAHKNMIVLFFVSTWYNDDSYRDIEKYLKEKKILYLAQTSIFDEEGNDSIREFMHEQEVIRRMEQEDEELEEVHGIVTPEQLRQRGENPLLACISQQEARKVCKVSKKKKKKKQEPPEYLIIMDDLSHELRHKSITTLAKNSRHYRMKLVLSSQDIKDLSPSTHEQIDYCILCKNTAEERLEYLHVRLSLWDSFEHFLRTYNEVTKKPYGFLLIDREDSEYRDGLFKILKQ